MDAKTARIAAGVALVGAGVVALRSLGPKLHERCRSACAGKCGSGAVKVASMSRVGCYLRVSGPVDGGVGWSGSGVLSVAGSR